MCGASEGLLRVLSLRGWFFGLCVVRWWRRVILGDTRAWPTSWCSIVRDEGCGEVKTLLCRGVGAKVDYYLDGYEAASVASFFVSPSSSRVCRLAVYKTKIQVPSARRSFNISSEPVQVKALISDPSKCV